MDSRTYSLSFILDKDEFVKKDLVTSNSLYKLDNYVKSNFNDNKEIRNKFDEEISEFCLDNMESIQKENKKNNYNLTEEIIILENIYHNGKLNDIKKIKVIYHGNNLMKRKNCLFQIKDKLEDDFILKELFLRKKYLLLQNEIDLLRLYFLYQDYHYKDSFIKLFIRKIEEENSINAYYYCRHLADLCDLIEVDKVKDNSPCQKNEKLSMDKVLKKEGMKNV